MKLLAALVGLFLLGFVLLEGFETIILPRTISRHLRLTRLFYVTLWKGWAALGTRVPHERRDIFLSVFGPLSLLVLLAAWAVVMIASFALIQWASGTADLMTDLYLSGVTFFTLGYGDVTPHTVLAKITAVLEAGLGFGFLAIVIGYLPVLYQTFSRREMRITMLDARASSPSAAGELLRRMRLSGGLLPLTALLQDWEEWSAELLESHLSYPVMAYYRSQHEGQSWLSALTTIMDVCALVIVGVDGAAPWQAQLTFAMGRHALVDLAYVFRRAPKPLDRDRLPLADLARLRRLLEEAGCPLKDGAEADAKLAELRGLYEPYANALGALFLLPLPPWMLPADALDNWQTSAWDTTHAHF